MKAVTKTEGDGQHPASHYLVVEDGTKPSTWHLRVKNVSGDLDHRLMGAAWAALHGGYRGNRYTGPNKAQAISKLTALYREEGLPLPGARALVKALEGGESGDWVLDVRGVPYGGPNDLDADGEYFDAQTNVHPDKFTNPPAVYYHGYDEHGTPHGAPVYIGKTVAQEERPDGRWYRVVLDKSNQYAQRIWNAAQNGLARASSGSVAHLIRRAGAHITEWPVAELSLLDLGDNRAPANTYAVAVPVMKAVYKAAGLTLPDEIENISADAPDVEEGIPYSTDTERSGKDNGDHEHKEMEMDKEQEDGLTRADVAQAVADALKAEREKQQKEAERAQEIEDAKKAAIEEARKEWEAKAAEGGRLPYNGEVGAPHVAKFGALRKFDGLDAPAQALLILAMKGAMEMPSEAAYQALAIKLQEDKTAMGEIGRKAMKAANLPHENGAVKADEVNYSSLGSGGDEWVGVSYSTNLWSSVRHETNIAGQLPSIEVPQGAESVVIPLESTDPTFYLTAQVNDDAASGGLSRPAPTVTSSTLGTAQQSLTLSKISARQRYSAELTEDSFVMWATQLQQQMARAAAEQFEHVLIDGDTATGASANINDITSTPAGTEAFLAVNGFRKIAIANNNTSGGAIDSDDYLTAVKLLGAAGKVGADPRMSAFIVDPNVYWKTLQNVTEAKTRDVWGASAPTIESGALTQLWGRRLFNSYSMHWISRAYSGYEYKANTAGKINQTSTSLNTTGSILAVRWDQWLLGWKRRMRVTTEYKPEWDGYQIVAHIRFGLVNRDTNAASIVRNLTV